jgi:type II secretory pathway pseudopilin PulG
MFKSPHQRALLPAGAGKPCRRGAVLVEVVLALALFVAAAAVISGALSASMDSVERLRLNAHAANLAVTVLSELQMGTLAAEGVGPQEFDLPFEDWTWEVLQAPVDDGTTEESRLTHIEVIIRHKASPLVHRLNQVLRLSPHKSTQSSATAGGT